DAVRYTVLLACGEFRFRPHKRSVHSINYFVSVIFCLSKLTAFSGGDQAVSVKPDREVMWPADDLRPKISRQVQNLMRPSCNVSGHASAARIALASMKLAPGERSRGP